MPGSDVPDEPFYGAFSTDHSYLSYDTPHSYDIAEPTGYEGFTSRKPTIRRCLRIPGEYCFSCDSTPAISAQPSPILGPTDTGEAVPPCDEVQCRAASPDQGTYEDEPFGHISLRSAVMDRNKLGTNPEIPSGDPPPPDFPGPEEPVDSPSSDRPIPDDSLVFDGRDPPRVRLVGQSEPGEERAKSESPASLEAHSSDRGEEIVYEPVWDADNTRQYHLSADTYDAVDPPRSVPGNEVDAELPQSLLPSPPPETDTSSRYDDGFFSGVGEWSTDYDVTNELDRKS